MRLRALPLVAGAVLALVPSAASADESPRPVQNLVGSARTATGEVQLSDGRSATVSLRQSTEGRLGPVWTEIELAVDCEGWHTCEDGGSTLTDLAGDQLVFNPGLGSASVTDVPVVLHGFAGTRPYDDLDIPVVVSVRFDGVGGISRSAGHSTQCGLEDARCQSITVEGTRAADVSLSINGLSAGNLTGAGTGSISSGTYRFSGSRRQDQ